MYTSKKKSNNTGFIWIFFFFFSILLFYLDNTYIKFAIYLILYKRDLREREQERKAKESKNTSNLNVDLGNFFFLSELIEFYNEFQLRNCNFIFIYIYLFA